MNDAPHSRKMAPSPAASRRRTSETLDPASKPAKEAGQPTEAEPPAALDVARYIAQMTTELASIARSTDLQLLAYFLEMARVEATNLTRKLDASASQPQDGA